ncbi:MAG: cryptochrome/photolyase family protein [Actinomycetes bacterium]
MASSDGTSLVWLRDDLRLDDNPALAEAARRGSPLTIVYILDEESDGVRPLGGAARWWLHHSLAALAADLESHGSRLVLRRGAADGVIRKLAAQTRAGHLFWNRRYGLPERNIDAGLKDWAAEEGIEAASFQANLLFEPWTIRTGAGGPYKVYSPFWRACLASGGIRDPYEVPDTLPGPAPVGLGMPDSEALSSWDLLPSSPDWSGGLAEAWEPGEKGGLDRLSDFLDGPIEDYGTGRTLPGTEGTSRLSPYLRFGEVSPFRVWREIRRRHPHRIPADVGTYQAELGWREFNWHLLYHNPALATRNVRPAFDNFPWETPSKDELTAWQQGNTGYPLVDAGMRQLWQTGWMHNRVRMAAASFLVKNLLTDWRIGEEWFWDTLVDADPANNPANWQWVAGSGADASPYYRIFNPVTQSRKFDAGGAYLRAFVPELRSLQGKAIHEPWTAEAPGYPKPLVDLPATRERALDAYQQIKDA